MAEPAQHADVAIVGAGVVGAAVAHYLTATGACAAGSILLIERDPAFQTGATGRSAGGVRLQFSTPENIAMSRVMLDLLRDLAATFGAGADVSFRPHGYLLLASAEGRAVLAANHAAQSRAGAGIALLEAAALAQRFPWLAGDGLAAGCHGIGIEGWLDPASLAQLFRRSALARGARMIVGDVTGMPLANARAIASLELGDGRRIVARHVVNAAGPWAGALARMAGVVLPVEPRKRFVYVLDCRDADAALHQAPLTVDPSGVWFRPEGQRFLAGRSPEPDREPAIGDLDAVDHDFFETDIWPVLAARVPAFGAVRVANAWAGYYDYNTFDQNAVIGRHPRIANLYFANGFSGHGLQQAAAAGRAIAELIVHGRFTTLDLTRLGFERIEHGERLAERNVI